MPLELFTFSNQTKHFNLVLVCIPVIFVPRRTGDQHKPHWDCRRQTTAPLSCVFLKPYRQGILQTLRVFVEGAACFFLAALSIVFPRDTNNRIHSNHKVPDSRLLELRNYFARTREVRGESSLISFKDILRLFSFPPKSKAGVRESIRKEHFNSYCFTIQSGHLTQRAITTTSTTSSDQSEKTIFPPVMLNFFLITHQRRVNDLLACSQF